MIRTKVKRPSQAIRIPIPTYNLLCTEAALYGQQIFDFVGTLLEVWINTGTTVKSKALQAQAEKKKIELEQLLKEMKKAKRA